MAHRAGHSRRLVWHRSRREPLGRCGSQWPGRRHARKGPTQKCHAPQEHHLEQQRQSLKGKVGHGTQACIRWNTNVHSSQYVADTSMSLRCAELCGEDPIFCGVPSAFFHICPSGIKVTARMWSFVLIRFFHISTLHRIGMFTLLKSPA